MWVPKFSNVGGLLTHVLSAVFVSAAPSLFKYKHEYKHASLHARKMIGTIHKWLRWRVHIVYAYSVCI
jgi:hypothetical protein